MKVIIGSRVPPRVSMFEFRTGSGLYMQSMPPIQGDAILLQSALLQKNRIPRRRTPVWPALVGVAVLVAGWWLA